MLSGNRFRLVTLGRLTLLGPAGEEDASLSKRRFKLALLAVLALARRPLSRDALLGMFWPEQPEPRARHSLSNALSSLRRSLGQRAITTREADVALAPDLHLEVDALQLAEAIEAGDYGRAIGLYGGPFLEGVHVEDSPGFEQWMSRERRRLEALFVQACARQCAMLARSRRWPECQEVAARWLDIEPLSSDAALFLLNAIKAPGTRAAMVRALEEYERLRTRLAREFEAAPDAVVRDLAERVREQLATLAAEPEDVRNAPTAREGEPLARPVSRGAAESATPAASASSVPNAARASSLPGAAPAPSLRGLAWARPFTGRRLWWLAGALAAPAVVLLALVWRDRPMGQGTSRPVIAILRLELRHDDSTLAWLADGLPQMIGGHLARNAAVDVVAPSRLRALRDAGGDLSRTPTEMVSQIGRRTGATIVAQGVIGRDGDALVLDLTAHDVASGALVVGAVLARNDPLALADEAAARIVTAATARGPGPQLAELETTSLAAYQHYVRALEAGHAGRLTESVRELDAALALDSGFMSALRARIDVAHGGNDTTLIRRLRETMRRHDHRATQYDRLHQEAYDAFIGGERERSQALARALVRQYPRDPRAYQLLQSILGSHGVFDEAERVAEEGVVLDSIARATGANPCAACLGLSALVNLHWVRGDLAGAAEWARRWIRSQPDGASAWAALAWTYSYQQRPDSALPLMERAISLSGGDLWAINEYARMLLVARRYASADSVIATLEASAMSERREVGSDLRAMLEREYGRPRASNQVIERLIVAAPSWRGFGEIMQADNLRLLGQHAEAARRYEAQVHAPNEGPLRFPLPANAARAFCWHHALAADAVAPTGDAVAMRATADTLEQACSRSFYGRDWRLYHHVRGLVAMVGGDLTAAEREFAEAVWTPIEGWARTTVELAAAQAALGRPRDAIATLRTAYATRLDAMGRYVPISELDYRMALAFAAAGQADSARVYGDYARRAWYNADPEIRRLLARLP